MSNMVSEQYWSSNRTLGYNMSQAKAKIIQFRVTEQDYAYLIFALNIIYTGS